MTDKQQMSKSSIKNTSFGEDARISVSKNISFGEDLLTPGKYAPESPPPPLMSIARRGTLSTTSATHSLGRQMESVYDSSSSHSTAYTRDRRERSYTSRVSGIRDAADPGARMAIAASGLRLKATHSYHGLRIWDTSRKEQASAQGGEDDEMFAEFTMGKSDGLKGWSLFTIIPFWVQALLLVFVPIAFLSAYKSIDLHKGIVSVGFQRGNADALQLMIDCIGALQIERGMSSQFLVSIPAEEAEVRDRMLGRRAATDASCNGLLRELQESSFPVMQDRFRGTVRHVVEEVALLRYQVNERTVAPPVFRAHMTAAVFDIIGGIALLSSESPLFAKEYLQLIFIRHAANAIGLCRAIGSAIVGWGSPAPPALKNEFLADCYEAYRRAIDDFTVVADGPALAAFTAFQENEAASYGFQLVEAVKVNTDGVFPLTRLEMFDAITATLKSMLAVSNVLLDTIVDAQLSRTAVVNDSLMLSFSLIASLVGALLLVRAQRQATERVYFAMERTKVMTLAVQAFIPRDFLRNIGSTLQSLQRGDQARCCLTILFCDIRNFTSISESMSNDELFTWLQAHVERMTKTTESHNGFVEKFVGDAVSSVFHVSADALRCAASMQLMTDELCVMRIANGNDMELRVGVGIHRCNVSVGILGNEKHYSAIIVGHETAAPSELDNLTKVYGARILMSQEVLDDISAEERSEFSFRCLGQCVTAVGVFTLYDVFMVDSLKLKQFKEDTKSYWERAVAFKDSGEAEEARNMFTEIQSKLKQLRLHDRAVAAKLKNVTKLEDEF